MLSVTVSPTLTLEEEGVTVRLGGCATGTCTMRCLVATTPLLSWTVKTTVKLPMVVNAWLIGFPVPVEVPLKLQENV